MSPQPGLSQRAHWAGGQPISHLMHLALAHPELISLAAGFVDQATLPVDAARDAIEAVLSDPGRARAALQYGTTPGYQPLREAILERLRSADKSTADGRISVDQVVITGGSNQLLHLVGETLLDPGDLVLCASPIYFVFLGMIGNQGARGVGVAADEQGMVPEALDEELARRSRSNELDLVKVIYLTSYYDNPASTTLPAERRAKIVEIAKRWSQPTRIYVVDDIAYRELRYEGQDVPSLRSFDAEGDTVIVAGTFSKSFSPGIRIGWGILPPQLVTPVCEQKGNIDFGAPNFAQHVMAAAFDRGLFDKQVELLRKNYKRKMLAMLEAADKYLAPIKGVHWHHPQGGLYVWLAVPQHIDTGPNGPLIQHALAAGVLYVPGEYCYPAAGEPPKRNMIRLSFGVQGEENIRRGIRALAEAIGKVQKREAASPAALGK